MLDIELLRTFVAIAESGSFTRAAEEVHKTQSAVSMQMKKLEEQIGRPLFERDGRRIRLSRDGLRLLDYAQRLVRLNLEASAAFTDPQLQGSVILGLPDDYDRLLPGVLSAFARTHPHIELAVHCTSSLTLKGCLERGEVDIAIVTLCDMTAPAQVVRREKLHWVSGQGHGAYLGTPLPIAVGAPSCAWRRSATEALDLAGIPYRIAYTSESANALSGAVIAGLAVSILPESAIRPEMRILDERDGFPPLPPCEIGMLRARHATSAIHDALADHIVSRIGNLPAARLEAAE
ncbi:LysR family transcriptional regulator [Lutibaculum baratangense]|uniref:Transcriptional regulator, LysR family n=1 Tax=Lutibaculum baratangense AMV1 TaxID=631454 RepID=V4RFM6_9HYPH|nr:LysR family transcriptional regulator [Lutibaculum baratangense]ESR24946.1 Transcriptional regulator, LysR family [Lutibaculum baratangense AMV1]